MYRLLMLNHMLPTVMINMIVVAILCMVAAALLSYSKEDYSNRTTTLAACGGFFVVSMFPVRPGSACCVGAPAFAAGFWPARRQYLTRHGTAARPPTPLTATGHPLVWRRRSRDPHPRSGAVYCRWRARARARAPQCLPALLPPQPCAARGLHVTHFPLALTTTPHPAAHPPPPPPLCPQRHGKTPIGSSST